MESIKNILRFAIIAIIWLMVVTCQKEEAVMLNPEDETITEALQLKSSDDALYYYHLIFYFPIKEVEDLVENGTLSKGNGKALIAKLEAARQLFVYRYYSGNGYEPIFQMLNAYKNLIDSFVDEEKISPKQGEELKLWPNEIIEGLGHQSGEPFHDVRDGKYYSTVQIGDQCWMAENLAYLPEVYPCNVIPPQTPPPHLRYYVYGYEGTDTAAAKQQANYTTYGVLYTWEAAMTGPLSSSTNPGGMQGICPIGWHLPSDDEWKQLETFIGMLPGEVDSRYWRGTFEGSKLKAKSGWLDGAYDGSGTDDFGFSALPAGDCGTAGNSENLGISATFWSSTSVDGSIYDFPAWLRGLLIMRDDVWRMFSDHNFAFSIRCVKTE